MGSMSYCWQLVAPRDRPWRVYELEAWSCFCYDLSPAEATAAGDASGLAPSPTRSCPFFKKRALSCYKSEKRVLGLVYMLR